MKKKDIRDVQKKIEEYTKEDLAEAFRAFEKKNPKEARLPKITHYEWWEDGKHYSSWKIDTGNNILNCGDGGMEMFLKAFQEQGFKLPKND